jgi:acyl-CoA-binding protein
MKKLVLLLLIVGLGATFMLASPYKQDFEFNGANFTYFKKMSGGVITNYMYHPQGEEINEDGEFVQIIDMGKIPKADWLKYLKQLYRGYGLSAIGDDNEFRFSGHSKRRGLAYNAYATLLTVKGKEQPVIYVELVDEDEAKNSDSYNRDIIYDLESIALR